MFYLKMNKRLLVNIDFLKFSEIRGPNSLIIPPYVTFGLLSLHERDVKQGEILPAYVVFHALST